MTINELLFSAIAELKAAGVENPRLDAEILLSNAMNVERIYLVMERDLVVSGDVLVKFNNLIKSRCSRKPIAYLIKEKEFYGLNFQINESVLIPRPETELLVDLVIYHAPSGGTILDLCTGSGAIACAVKKNRPDLFVEGSDLSSAALDIARLNSERICGQGRINFYKGDLFASIKDRRYDIIVSNPPYIDEELDGVLAPELAYEPRMALYAADKGLALIKRIISESLSYLTPQGKIIFEIAEYHQDYIPQYAAEYGFKTSILKDYAGLPRIALCALSH